MIACQVFWIQNIIAAFILCFCTADKLYFSKMEIRTVTDIHSPKLISLYIAENSQNDDWLLTVIALKIHDMLNVSFGGKIIRFICNRIFQISHR